MFSLNISSIINLFFTFSMILLVYFYLKKRLDCVENKVDIMFNLIQEHQKQIKMQEIMNAKNVCGEGFCNVSDFSLPMCKDKECDEHVNDNSDESETSDSQSEDENETDDESDDDIQIGEVLSQHTESNNALDVVDVDNVEKNKEQEEEEHAGENTNQEVTEVNLVDNDVVEPTEQNVNNWTQNNEGDNITVLEDNNNNKIKISIVKNVDSNVDYSKLKVQELKKIASERHIVGYSSLKKRELIKLLE